MSNLWQQLQQDRRLRAVLTTLVWGTALLLLGRVVARAWQSLQVYSLHFSAVPLLLSMVVLVAAFLNGALGWHLLLQAMGVYSPWQKDMADWLMAQASKYLPAGTVWYLGGRFLQGRRNGLDSATVSVALALEFAFYLIDALALFGLSLWLWPGIPQGWLGSVITLAVITLGWLLMPHAVQYAGRWLSSKEPGMGQALQRIQGRRLRWLPPFYLFQWALIGLAFWSLVRSVYPVLPQELLVMGGAFSLSAALGYLVFFIPGGWGVREGALTLLLEPFVPVGAMISVLARLWYTVIEGACVLLGWVIQRSVGQ